MTVDPPVDLIDRPATHENVLPIPEFPLPTSTCILPPRPAVAGEVPMRTGPLFPRELDPVLNTKCPLDPSVAIFALDVMIDPLLVLSPGSFEIKTKPPEPVAPLPPVSVTRPPIPCMPLPPPPVSEVLPPPEP